MLRLILPGALLVMAACDRPASLDGDGLRGGSVRGQESTASDTGALRGASLDTLAPEVPSLTEGVWAEARRRGMALRGVGNEPGWLVEVHPARGLRVLLDYGVDSVIVNAPARAEAADSLVYTGANGRAVRVVARAVPCQDAMSGASFPQTVTVTVSGRRLTGCGVRY